MVICLLMSPVQFDGHICQLLCLCGWYELLLLPYVFGMGLLDTLTICGKATIKGKYTYFSSIAPLELNKCFIEKFLKNNTKGLLAWKATKNSCKHMYFVHMSAILVFFCFRGNISLHLFITYYS